MISIPESINSLFSTRFSRGLPWTPVEKATSAIHKSDIYARRVLGRRARLFSLGIAEVCGFPKATWEAFKRRSGTDGW